MSTVKRDRDTPIGRVTRRTNTAGGGVTDHGALTGLGDDDHTQYVKRTESVDALTDVDTTTDAPNLNEVLKWNGSDWVPGSGAATSYAFITDITGAGTISNKTYEANTVPTNKILTAAESDNDDITVHLEIHVLSDDWQPASVEISGAGATPVTVNKQDWTQVDNTRIFTATANLTDADTTGTITATMSDGDTATCSYTRALDPPLVLSAVIDDHSTNTGGDPHCPYAQTQVKQGDTLDISGTAESHADEVYVKDTNVTNGQGLQGPFTVTAGSWSGAINVGSGNENPSKYVCYAKVTGGTPGADFNSTETVDKNQTSPNLALSSVSYPGTQEALKDDENAEITVTDSNRDTGDTYEWDDNSTNEFDDLGTMAIGNSSADVDAGTYDNTSWNGGIKWVERQAGNYRDDGDSANARITATRTAKNGASASLGIVVEIAHAAPQIKIDDAYTSYASGGSPARMGSDDGTNGYKDRNIYVISDQKHLSTSTSSIAPDAGDTSAFTGSWTEYNDYSFRRNFRVEDGDINAGGQAANNFSWSSPSVTNRAGKQTTSITKNPTYSIGGFETRTLNMGPITGGDPPYTHTADIGCPVVDTAKTTVYNTSKGGSPEQTYEGNVTEHNDADSSLNNYWTTVSALGSEVFDDYTQYFHCSDKKFYESVTAPAGFNCTIAESA